MFQPSVRRGAVGSVAAGAESGVIKNHRSKLPVTRPTRQTTSGQAQTLYQCQETLERYERIEEMKNDYSTEVLCEAFCISRSGFYDWLERRRNPSARAKLMQFVP